MTACRVSVLMPCHNASETLQETLLTIRNQSYGDYELLIVNDGSTDATASILRNAAGDDPRIRVLEPGRMGLVAALNLGLAEAKGELVARMDADDRMRPERLYRQVIAMDRDPTLDLVASRVHLFPEEEIQAGLRTYVHWQNRCLTPHDHRHEIYWESPLAHPSVMFRRSTVMALGGYRNGDFPEDYDLWLRMVAAGCRIRKLPEVLLEWRNRSKRLTWIDPRYRRQAFDQLRAHYLAGDRRLHGGRDVIIVGAGRRTRQRVQQLLEYGFRVAAWVDVDPRRIGQVIQGAPVITLSDLPSWQGARALPPFMLCYVTNHGARDTIQHQLEAMGFTKGRDWLMVG
ncbi:MAG: glycosyltransferase [Magnetococcales bacterium]|nr:glycosyltransferase [Magnetococcales bacterium]